MCGIAGIFADDPRVAVTKEALAAMGQALAHRGPDGSGVHCGAGYGLAHRRLAIVDLSPLGAQPMSDARRELHVVFNGEIYNHAELRAELEARGHRFVSRADTEVLLHGWREWGTGLPAKLRGMFAFALVDERDRSLFLARDRLGKKPLYLARDAGQLAFASELKALRAGWPGLSRALDPQALAQFLALRYVPDPRSIFGAIAKLPPAHWLLRRGGREEQQAYWRVSFAAADRVPLPELEAQALDLLDEAVRIRLMGEVPLGAFLSGGIDSYAVVESMARASSAPVVACTIGFPAAEFDERPQARAAAAATGAVLHEGVVTATDLLQLDWFGGTFDEPFADASAVPTWHVSRIARRHVTVALSGDGGDESFAGYRRYRIDGWEQRLRHLLPEGIWRLLGAVYPKLDAWPRYLRWKRTFANLALRPAEAYARSVSASLPEEVLPLLRGHLRAAAGDPLAPVIAAYDQADAGDPLQRAIAADLATYLPGDILVKVDRASMAVSLEVRAPLLDHRLVEFAARLPSRLKLLGGQSKGFLRHALRTRLAPAALARSKRGFSVPLADWLRGPVGDGLERSLAAGPLAEWLEIARLRDLLQTHRSGRRDHAEILWAAVVLDHFLRRWVA